LQPKYKSIMTDTDVFENKTVAYYTLGCKLNFAEISAIGKELSALGIRKARQGEQADFCIINTCSVTELADKKCRQMIRRIHKLHPSAFTIVTGCYAQLNPEGVSSMDGVDLVVGAEHKSGITQYIKDVVDKKRELLPRTICSPVKDIRAFAPSCSSDDRTRFFLKVQDGCDYFCSYCTIPFARGRSRNGIIDDLVRQAVTVAKEGGKEIVLTGVNIGDFGKSTGENLMDLLKALEQVEGILRYRLSSLEPDLISDELISFVAGSDRFMPHFHVPLQSGCNEVLRLMRRRYDTGLFRRKIELIRELMPDAFVGVDVIAGIRGETDRFFEESFAFIDSIPFSELHVFGYSERQNTQALSVGPVVEPAIRHGRCRRLLVLSERRRRDFYGAHVGMRARVLFEHGGGRSLFGFTENYIRTEVAFHRGLCNEVRSVVLTGWNSDFSALRAEVSDC
jgi:threonylcarbamoyladenosine tRNA methylthiotransferase MtaB